MRGMKGHERVRGMKGHEGVGNRLLGHNGAWGIALPEEMSCLFGGWVTVMRPLRARL